MTSVSRNVLRGVALGLSAAAVTLPAAAQAATTTSPAKVSQASAIDHAATQRLSSRASALAIHPMTTVSLAESGQVACDGSTATASYNDGVISYGINSGQVYGDSYGRWMGGSPVNANSITLTDNYTISGLGTSWNGPNGGGWTGMGSGSATFSMSGSNLWQLHHGGYEVQWGGLSSWFSQTTEADIYLPGTACSAEASGTKYTP